jgi:hypothetical protein
MSHGSYARRAVVLFALLVATTLPGCGPPSEKPSPAAALPAEADIPLREFGQLQVFVTGQTSDGRNIKLRGLIRNPYADTVEGARLVFRMFTRVGPDATELDRMQKVIETRLGSGEQTALRWDLQSMYAGQSGVSGFTVQAFAITRGGEELPAPPDWKQ